MTAGSKEQGKCGRQEQLGIVQNPTEATLSELRGEVRSDGPSWQLQGKNRQGRIHCRGADAELRGDSSRGWRGEAWGRLPAENAVKPVGVVMGGKEQAELPALWAQGEASRGGTAQNESEILKRISITSECRMNLK